jgi:hypothetical protein
MGYGTNDDVQQVTSSRIYYRLKITNKEGRVKYTKAISLSLIETNTDGMSIAPNPVRDIMQINISSAKDNKAQLFIYDFKGKLVRTESTNIQKGNSVITVSGLETWPRGVYSVTVVMGDDRFVKKMVLTK